MRVTKDDFDKFVQHCKQKVPGFAVHDGKRDSYLMNWIDGVIYPLFPGARDFLDDYTTTLAGSVYFPRGYITRNPGRALRVAGHEFIHADDARRLTFPVFSALYLSFISFFFLSLLSYGIFGSWFALIPFGWVALHSATVGVSFKLRKISGFPLLILALVATIGLSFWDDGWGALWLLGSLVFLAPLPAPGRYWAEHRGYGGSITFEVELYGRANITPSRIRQFVGPPYYWMMPFPKWVADKLKSYETRALEGNVTDPAFLHVLKFMRDLKAR